LLNRGKTPANVYASEPNNADLIRRQLSNCLAGDHPNSNAIKKTGALGLMLDGVRRLLG